MWTGIHNDFIFTKHPFSHFSNIFGHKTFPMRILIPVTVFLLSILACTSPGREQPEKPARAKNVILLIGDGLGLAQLSTAYYYSDTTPNFSRFKVVGLHQPQPAGGKITDSAAGATAFSTGVKSFNSAIGVAADSSAKETLLEIASRRDKQTGVVATSSITHATPASFFAHVVNRNFHEEIALQFVDAPVDFAAGGGYQYFCQRSDSLALLDTLSARGVVWDTTALDQNPNAETLYAFVRGPDRLHSMRGGRGDFLPRAASTAINHLSSGQNGFFLMIEGSQIDWGGHANNAEYIITEVADFDKTVGKVLDFAQKDGNTLVVVTADHETGGFALSSLQVYGRRDYGYIQPTFSTGGHTATLIPVLAYGPGAEAFAGIYQNNEIFDKILKAME